jgi:hypothetical protein
VNSETAVSTTSTAMEARAMDLERAQVLNDHARDVARDHIAVRLVGGLAQVDHG